MKRTLRCWWYVRYVDDLVLLADDPEQLRRWRAAIAGFPPDRLRLDLRAEVAEYVAPRLTFTCAWSVW